MPPPPGYSISNKIFEDSFSGTSQNRTKWNTYLTSKAWNGLPKNSNGSGGTGEDAGGYDAEYFEPSQVSVNNGLTLTAVPGSAQPGYEWTSGVVSTYGKFEFEGGYIQFKAKMPGGNGMWPGLWMTNGPGSPVGLVDDQEIDVFEGGMNVNGQDPSDNASWHTNYMPVEGGTVTTIGGTTNTSVDLADGYHIYGLKWIPGVSLTWYVDGVQIGQVTSSQTVISDEPMQIIMTLQVANSSAAAWHTTYDSSTPSPSTMEIAEVQVYQ